MQFHPEISVAKTVNQSEDAENYTDYDTSLSFFKAIIEAGQEQSEEEEAEAA